jgi:hypothetical protein
MIFYGEPRTEYSADAGKTWDEQPKIGDTVLMRVITQDARVLYSAHAEYTSMTCDCCEGTGVRKLYRFVEDKKEST